MGFNSGFKGLTDAPVIVHCISNQLNGCPTVPTTGLYGKHSYICK